MKRMTVCATLALFACLVVMASATSASGGERLPHFYQGHETIRIALSGGQTTYSGWGEATHLGLFRNEGTGQTDTGSGDFTLAGTITAADGSQIEWTGYGNLYTGEYSITLIGGSGRFENATGALPTWESTNMTQVIEDGFMIITFDTSATGWISF